MYTQTHTTAGEIASQLGRLVELGVELRELNERLRVIQMQIRELIDRMEQTNANKSTITTTNDADTKNMEARTVPGLPAVETVGSECPSHRRPKR